LTPCPGHTRSASWSAGRAGTGRAAARTCQSGASVLSVARSGRDSKQCECSLSRNLAGFCLLPADMARLLGRLGKEGCVIGMVTGLAAGRMVVPNGKGCHNRTKLEVFFSFKDRSMCSSSEAKAANIHNTKAIKQLLANKRCHPINRL